MPASCCSFAQCNHAQRLGPAALCMQISALQQHAHALWVHGRFWLMPETHTQDVTSREDGRLIGRAFVSPPALLTLQGSISATLISPQLEMVRTHLLTSPQSRHHSWLLQRSPQRRQCALLCSVMRSGGNQDQHISCAVWGCDSGSRQ